MSEVLILAYALAAIVISITIIALMVPMISVLVVLGDRLVAPPLNWWINYWTAWEKRHKNND